MPFYDMAPHGDLISGGGAPQFCLAAPGHHYLVYTSSGGFNLELEGAGLQASWYDPRDPDAVASDPEPVAAGSVPFSPPAGGDWVLWVSDGSDLAPGITHPTAGSQLTTFEVP